jgi:NADPH2:quinone reductase
MKAAWYQRKGPAAQVLQVGEQPDPQPAPGEVRVRIQVSAVNPSDTKNRSGLRGMAMPFPVVIPHQDGAGVIDQVGEGVDPARIGERVWVYEATWSRPGGTAAQYTTVPAAKAVWLPDGVSFEAGACLGIPAMTAHRCVFADGPVTGLHVLIQGGAGAVGFYAVQMARIGGAARVIATVSRPEQAELARRAGADTVIDYRAGPVPAAVAQALGGPARVDRIIEVAFGANLSDDLEMCAPRAVIAAYASDAVPQPQLPFWQMTQKDLTLRAVLVYQMSVAAHEEAARWITAALAKGRLQHPVDKVFPLVQVAATHEACETMKNLGKVLVHID